MKSNEARETLDIALLRDQAQPSMGAFCFRPITLQTLARRGTAVSTPFFYQARF